MDSVRDLANYLHPALASQLESQADDPFRLTGLVLATTFVLALAPPSTVIMRKVRGSASKLTVVFLIYRFISLFRNGGVDNTENNVFDFAVSQILSGWGAVSGLANKYLSDRLGNTLLTCVRDFAGILLLRGAFRYFQKLTRTSVRELKAEFWAEAFSMAQMIPLVQAELKKEKDKMIIDLEKSLKDKDRKVTAQLPKVGRTARSLILDLTKRGKKEDEKWELGKVSGAVYCGEREHTELMNAAYAAFSLSNPLHPDIWPSVNQFEGEICSMVCGMLNGGNTNVCAALTSGGTESIVLATKSTKDYYCKKNNIKYPEIISCVTAHAAIDKACGILGIRHIRVGYVKGTYKIDMDEVRRKITSDTIMIYSSAPTFPQGIIDPISELAALAVKHDCGLHVDCCLGGFVLPFARKLGYPVPAFDFELKGVSTISCDTHKYGYAAKGTSVVLYRDSDLRRSQYFCYPEWTGGLYVTPTIAGSRPGALSAACWASMMAMGEDGYMERVERIMECRKRLQDVVAGMPGLQIMGSPQSMIICFTSEQYNIYRVSDKMAHKGWSLNTLQRPACIHLCVTLRTVENESRFEDELRACVNEVVEEGNDVVLGGNAAIYGMSGSMPAGPVNELLKTYTDVMLTP